MADHEIGHLARVAMQAVQRAAGAGNGRRPRPPPGPEEALNGPTSHVREVEDGPGVTRPGPFFHPEPNRGESQPVDEDENNLTRAPMCGVQ